MKSQTQQKALLQLFETVPALDQLCVASQRRLKSLTVVNQVPHQTPVTCRDGVKCDLYYIVSGCLMVTLEEIGFKQLIPQIAHCQEDPSCMGVKMLELKEGQYLDYMSKQIPKGYRISEIFATQPTTFITLSYPLYHEYVNDPLRTAESITALLNNLLPGLKQRSSVKRQCILGAFEELAIEPNVTLESEGTQANYIYLVLKGELSMFKKLPSMYQENGHMIKCDKVELIQNPKDSGHQNEGICIGGMTGPSLLGEDAVLFGEPLKYSIVTKNRVLLFRYKATDVRGTKFNALGTKAAQSDHRLIWPSEIQKTLQLETLEKYRWFFERIGRLETSLKQSLMQERLDNGLWLDKRSHFNYPVGSEVVRDNMRKKRLGELQGNVRKFLGEMNPRPGVQLDVKGAVTEKDEKRLTMIQQRYLPASKPIKKIANNTDEISYSIEEVVAFENKVIKENPVKHRPVELPRKQGARQMLKSLYTTQRLNNQSRSRESSPSPSKVQLLLAQQTSEYNSRYNSQTSLLVPKQMNSTSRIKEQSKAGADLVVDYGKSKPRRPKSKFNIRDKRPKTGKMFCSRGTAQVMKNFNHSSLSFIKTLNSNQRSNASIKTRPESSHGTSGLQRTSTRLISTARITSSALQINKQANSQSKEFGLSTNQETQSVQYGETALQHTHNTGIANSRQDFMLANLTRNFFTRQAKATAPARNRLQSASTLRRPASLFRHKIP